MLSAISGEGFAITSIPCCGDEIIVDALDEAGIGWSNGTLKTAKWDEEKTPVLMVLRDPVSWYREYIMDATQGLGEFYEVDGEIRAVFQQLASEPELALNVAAINICAKQPGWLSNLYRMYELKLVPIWTRTALMDYKDVATGLKSFLLGAGVDGAENLPDKIELKNGDDLPLLLDKCVVDIRREESRAYAQFGVLMNW